MTNISIRFESGQLILNISETYAGGGSTQSINLTEHIREIVREELDRHPAAHGSSETK